MEDSDLDQICQSLKKYFKINNGNHRSILMICIGIIIWTDYLIFLINFVRSIHAEIDEDCFHFEMGCIFFGQSMRVVGNLLMISYRTILFLLYNRWYVDDHQWLRMVYFHYGELVKEDIQLSFETIDKTIRKALVITIMITIFLNTSYSIIQDLNFYDQLLNHLYITLSTYLSGFFITLLFILNNICVSLLQQYYQRFHLHLSDGSLKPKFVQSFWNLYLMIQYAKVYLKDSYMIIVGCLLTTVLEFYYITFYSEIQPFKRYVCAILLFIIIQNIISFSVIFSHIDVEANALSDLAYEYVNVRRFLLHSESNHNNGKANNVQPKFGYSGYSKLPEMIDCLNQNLGVEVMNTHINAANIVKVSENFCFCFLLIIYR